MPASTNSAFRGAIANGDREPDQHQPGQPDADLPGPAAAAAAHEGAQIINVGSTFGSIGYPGFSAYCASKFGLRGFTESLRRELADSGLQVSYIAPRATETDLNSDNIVAMNDALGTAMDEPSLVADEVMQIISTPVASDKYLGWPEKLFVRINALLPALVDSSLRKQLPIIRRFAKHEI